MFYSAFQVKSKSMYYFMISIDWGKSLKIGKVCWILNKIWQSVLNHLTWLNSFNYLKNLQGIYSPHPTVQILKHKFWKCWQHVKQSHSCRVEYAGFGPEFTEFGLPEFTEHYVVSPPSSGCMDIHWGTLALKNFYKLHVVILT